MPPRWVIHHVLAAGGSEVVPAFARQLLGGSGLRDEPGSKPARWNSAGRRRVRRPRG